MFQLLLIMHATTTLSRLLLSTQLLCLRMLLRLSPGPGMRSRTKQPLSKQSAYAVAADFQRHTLHLRILTILLSSSNQCIFLF